MSLTKEMIVSIENEVKTLNDDMLKVYNTTYRDLNNKYPNSFFQFRIKQSDNELINRGYEQWVSNPFNQ